MPILAISSVKINPNSDNSYSLFTGGGGGYGKPNHGAYSTFWNLQVHVLSKIDIKNPVVLNGIEDGPSAYIIGVNGNDTFKIEYEPNSYQEFINESLDHVPSLFEYRLKQRLK